MMAEDAQEVPRCGRCAAPMVDGTFAHDAGCSNENSIWDPVLEAFIRYLECPSCGASVLDGTKCNCQLDIAGEED